MPVRPLRHWEQAQAHRVDREGQAMHLRAWAGSPHSPTDARHRAHAKLADWSSDLAVSLDAFFDRHEYPYARAQLREDILEEGPWLDPLHPEEGVVWAVTRNRYGAQVLNTSYLAMLDLDAGDLGWSLWWRSLGRSPATRQRIRLEALCRWVEADPHRGARVYATAAGYRVLLTHRPYTPADPELQALMVATRTDRNYRQLCQVQGCFRGRLTAKPWRLQPAMDRAQWRPLPSGEHRPADEQAWLAQYEDASARTAACRLLHQWGKHLIHPDLVDLVTLHDTRTHAQVTWPLA